MAEVVVDRSLERRILGAAQRCAVSVPASTSNLGAGFDCIGIAVGPRIDVLAAIDESPGAPAVVITRGGTLESLDVAPEHDLIARGLAAACEHAGVACPPVLLSATSAIPVARGLGSSAAACIAGVLAADALLALDLSARTVVDIAAAIEGHPDNVAPAMLGGAVLGVRTARVPSPAWHVAPLRVDPALRFVFAIPDLIVETRAARAVLPTEVAFSTAVDAAARAAALVAGLASADPALLGAALDDVLHVPHRRALVRGYDDVVAAAIRHGAFGATLSGSGSSIVAIAPDAHAPAVADAMCAAWRRASVRAVPLVSDSHGGGATVHHPF